MGGRGAALCAGCGSLLLLPGAGAGDASNTWDGVRIITAVPFTSASLRMLLALEALVRKAQSCLGVLAVFLTQAPNTHPALSGRSFEVSHSRCRGLPGAEPVWCVSARLSRRGRRAGRAACGRGRREGGTEGRALGRVFP